MREIEKYLWLQLRLDQRARARKREAAEAKAKTDREAEQAERDRLAAEQRARAERFKPKPRETLRDRQLAGQAASARLRELGLQAPEQYHQGGLGRVLSAEEMVARGRRQPELTPEQAELRRRQDARLRQAGILGGTLVHPGE